MYLAVAAVGKRVRLRLALVGRSSRDGSTESRTRLGSSNRRTARLLLPVALIGFARTNRECARQYLNRRGADQLQPHHGCFVVVVAQQVVNLARPPTDARQVDDLNLVYEGVPTIVETQVDHLRQFQHEGRFRGGENDGHLRRVDVTSDVDGLQKAPPPLRACLRSAMRWFSVVGGGLGVRRVGLG